jgi:hypothetical protein
MTAVGMWECDQCVRPKGEDQATWQPPRFESEDQLLDHKLAMIEGGRGHLACHWCKVKYRSYDGMIRHYQTVCIRDEFPHLSNLH